MSKRHLLTAISLATGLLCAGLAEAAADGNAGGKTAEVNVFIGTGGDGHTFPVRPALRHDPAEPGHPGAPLQAELSLGRRLPLRGRFHPRLLAHPLFRRRPLDLGDVLLMPQRRTETGPGLSRAPVQRLPLALLAQGRAGGARLLRGQTARQRGRRRADRQRARRPAPLPLQAGRGRQRRARPAFQHLRLERQEPVVAPAPARPGHAHRHARNARLGARPPAVLRDPLLASTARHQLMNREEGVAYKGFALAGARTPEKVLVEGKALEAALGFGQLGDTPLLVKVAIRRQRGRRPGQPGRDAGLGLRRRTRPRARCVGTGAGCGRDRRAAAA
jgi:hypothetical protein